MNIRPHDTLSNLKNWPAYDYKDYRLNKDESDNCIAALENYIWHDVKKEGMPKEDGNYLFKLVSPDDEEPDYTSYNSDEEPDFGEPNFGDTSNPGLYPFVSERVLDYEELARYDLQQLKIMRNEIYARHGYIFRKGGEMEAYFKKQPWYQPLYTNVDQFLSSVETENIKKIRVLEGGN